MSGIVLPFRRENAIEGGLTMRRLVFASVCAAILASGCASVGPTRREFGAPPPRTSAVLPSVGPAPTGADLALHRELAELRRQSRATRTGVVIAGVALATAGVVGLANLSEADQDVKTRAKVPWISLAFGGLVAAGAAAAAGP
jgi:hypothetical protein